MSEFCCSHCGAPFSADSIDRRLGAARCTHCNGLTDVSDSPLMNARGEVPLPDRFRIHRDGERLTLVRPWFSLKNLVGLVMAAVPFVIVFGMLKGPNINGQPAPFFSQIPPLFVFLFTAAWGAGIYAALAGVVNRTILTIKDRVLRIRHLPLPWFPMPTVPGAQLEQVYCKRREVTRNKSVRIVYDVLAVMTDGRSRTLVSGLDTAAQAEFIEQEIEQTLGIQDSAVGGETADEF